MQSEGSAPTAWDTLGAAATYLACTGDAAGGARWAARAAVCAASALGKDSREFETYVRLLGGLEDEWVSAGKRLLTDGYVILDGFGGAHAAKDLAEQLTRLYRSAMQRDGDVGSTTTAEFRHGQIGGGADGGGADVRSNDLIRGDRRALIDVTDPRCPGLHAIFFMVDQLLGKMARGAGVAELRSVTHRSRPMLACYDNGGRYIRHVDNPDGNGRLLTCIYYLNERWSAADGGELVLYPTAAAGSGGQGGKGGDGGDGGGKRGKGGQGGTGGGVAPVVVEPLLDRLVCFWSDARTPHEVLPAARERMAVSTWYHQALPSHAVTR